MKNIVACLYGDILNQYKLIFQKINNIASNNDIQCDIILLVNKVLTNDTNVFENINTICQNKVKLIKFINFDNEIENEYDKQKSNIKDTDIARVKGNISIFFKIKKMGEVLNEYVSTFCDNKPNFDLIWLAPLDLYYYDKINYELYNISVDKNVMPNIMYNLDKLNNNDLHVNCQHLIISNYQNIAEIFNVYNVLFTELHDIYGPEDKIRYMFNKIALKYNIATYNKGDCFIDSWRTFTYIENNLFDHFLNKNDHLLYNRGRYVYKHDCIVFYPENIINIDIQTLTQNIDKQLYEGNKVLLHVFENNNNNFLKYTTKKLNSHEQNITNLWYVKHGFNYDESFMSLFGNQNWTKIMDNYFSHEEFNAGITPKNGKYFTGTTFPETEIDINDIPHDTIINIMNMQCLAKFCSEYNRLWPRIAWEYFVSINCDTTTRYIMTSERNIIDKYTDMLIIYDQSMDFNNNFFIFVNNEKICLPQKYIGDQRVLLNFKDTNLMQFSLYVKNDMFYGDYTKHYLLTSKNFLITPCGYPMTNTSIYFFPEKKMSINLCTNSEQNMKNYLGIYPFQIENNGTAAVCTTRYTDIVGRYKYDSNIFNTLNEQEYYFGDIDNFWKHLTVYIPAYYLDFTHDEWLLKSLSYQTDKNFTVLFIDPFCSKQRQQICKKASFMYNINIMWYPRKIMSHTVLGCRDYIHINDVCLITQSKKILAYGQSRLFSPEIVEICNKINYNISFARCDSIVDIDYSKKHVILHDGTKIKVNDEICSIDSDFYNNGGTLSNVNFENTYVQSINKNYCDKKIMEYIANSGDVCVFVDDLLQLNGVDETFTSSHYSEDINRCIRFNIANITHDELLSKYNCKNINIDKFTEYVNEARKNVKKKLLNKWASYDSMIVYIKNRSLKYIFNNTSPNYPEITVFPYLGLYKKTRSTDTFANAFGGNLYFSLLKEKHTNDKLENAYVDLLNKFVKNDTDGIVTNLDIKCIISFLKNKYILLPNSKFNVYYCVNDSCIVHQSLMGQYSCSDRVIFIKINYEFDFVNNATILFRDEFTRQLCEYGVANLNILHQGRNLKVLKNISNDVSFDKIIDFVEMSFLG